MSALLVLPLSVVGIYVTWVLYLCIMTLARARNDGKLPTVAYRLAYPILLVGYLVDFLLNVIVVTLILAELPRELLVSARLSRHIKTEGTGWRKSVSTWVCKNLLDWADPKGCHCR